MAFSSIIPAPTGGWNARDSLDSMKPEEALVLDNIFPGTDEVRLRGGTSLFATGAGVDKNFRSLMTYNTATGANKLLGAANLNLYEVTAGLLSSKASGLASNDWQHVNFGSKLILVNGLDTARQYDGTTVSTITYSGIPDPTKLINIGVYKDRLYFCESGTAAFWYAGNKAISGALTKFDLQYELRLGGFLQFTGGVTRDTGAGIEDVFVVCSSEGEVLIYSGLNPGDVTWKIIGRFFLSCPLGRRAFANIRNELYILTRDGIVPVSALLGGIPEKSASNTLTDKIRNAYTSATKLYGDNFGWSMHSYPGGDYLFVNVPLAENTTTHQYVMNTINGSWCRFTNMNAQAWAIFNDKLYFGGLDGTVFKSDDTNSDTSSDSLGTEISIPALVQWSFNYFKDRSRAKLFTMIAPIVIGDSSLTFQVGIDTDFQRSNFSASINIIGNEGSPWDTSAWDTSPWDTTEIYKELWLDISGEGRAMSLKLGGNYKSAPFSLSAVKVIYNKGGAL